MSRWPDWKTRLVLILTAALLLMTGLLTASSRGQGFYQRLNAIARPYGFNTALWEVRTFPYEVSQLAASLRDQRSDEIATVTDYFALTKKITTLETRIRMASDGTLSGDPAALEAELPQLIGQREKTESTVERILERQIKTVLVEQGILNPLDKYVMYPLNFPPLSFKLEEPPHVLVVSPRDRIQSLTQITLKQDLSDEEMSAIEAQVDSLGVSSLVTDIGGLATTYPTFVTNEGNLRFTLDAAAEEWLHQYLFFKPLGFRYALHLLGIVPNQEIADLNETIANLASKEIGGLVYDQYYSGITQPQSTPSALDFDATIRDIRKQVDAYLAQGEVEQVEAFMAQSRDYLEQNGYYIRKLNQAYFAFHNTYGEDPGSTSPIGAEVKALRNKSTSLKDFLDRVSGLASEQDLLRLLE
jgi:hypothetical protein